MKKQNCYRRRSEGLGLSVFLFVLVLGELYLFTAFLAAWRAGL